MGRKRRKQNGWKNKMERTCYYTEIPGAERHELFGGPNRQTSIDHGFQVDLHWAIHKLFHKEVDKQALRALQVPGMFPDPLGWAKEEQERLRQECQRRCEERDQIELGLTPQQARQEWMNLIGRNYLDDEF